MFLYVGIIDHYYIVYCHYKSFVWVTLTKGFITYACYVAIMESNFLGSSLMQKQKSGFHKFKNLKIVIRRQNRSFSRLNSFKKYFILDLSYLQKTICKCYLMSISSKKNVVSCCRISFFTRVIRGSAGKRVFFFANYRQISKWYIVCTSCTSINRYREGVPYTYECRIGLVKFEKLWFLHERVRLQ